LTTMPFRSAREHTSSMRCRVYDRLNWSVTGSDSTFTAYRRGGPPLVRQPQ
jgi:hypothetical protein